MLLPIVMAFVGQASVKPAASAATVAAAVSNANVAPGPGERAGRGSRGGKTRRTPVRMAKVLNAFGPSLSTSSRATLALRASLDLALRTRSGHWGVLVTSVSRGDTLFSDEPDRLLKPASTMKLMTTALALERLGADHTFETDVLADRAPASGVVNGNLYMKGGGDPTLSLRFSKGESPTDALARQVRSSGIEHVRGDVVADESAFAPERIPVGWKNSYRASAYAAPVSALSLNENLVWVDTRVINGRAVVTADPPSTTFPVTNSVRVVDGKGARIVVGRTKNGVMASGFIGADSPPRRYSLVVQDPPAFAAGALAASLAKVGVKVDGSVREGDAPRSSVQIASVHSQPLQSIISLMNRESINHYAELLFRSAAREGGRAGSATAALETLRGFLADKVGVQREAVRVRDGSGLSEADTLTARSLVQVLAYANHASWRSAYHMSLPVAGQTELLRRRMKATLAQGNLHAKTGTTNTVAALAGYVTARNGEMLAFAFIYNGRDIWNARLAMDRMGSTLASFYRD
ncbi:MAG TPA: D-alanyl-D-alanine carboxypeptidase/D-alanyl-D-alanine-endopeptidase [Gemmatimonadaceae bacterium]